MSRARPLILGAGALLGVLFLRRAASRRPSLRMQAAKIYLRLKRSKSRTSTLAEMERTYRARASPRPAPLTASLRALCEVEERQVSGFTVYHFTPRQGGSGWHVIYTPGGGYVNPPVSNHWDAVELLIRHTGAEVTVPVYPLAPEHTFQAAYSLLEAVYREVLTRAPAERVVLCGDSAGGGLAIGQALHHRDVGLPLPGRVVLFAPWLDLALSDPQNREVEARDVMLRVDRLRLMGRWWAGEADPKHPLLSPLYADLQGLPPIDVFQGTDDLFVVDARTFHRQAMRSGADVRLYETPGGFHVFMAVPWLPEAQDVYRQLARNLAVSLETRI